VKLTPTNVPTISETPSRAMAMKHRRPQPTFAIIPTATGSSIIQVILAGDPNESASVTNTQTVDATAMKHNWRRYPCRATACDVVISVPRLTEPLGQLAGVLRTQRSGEERAHVGRPGVKLAGKRAGIVAIAPGQRGFEIVDRARQHLLDDLNRDGRRRDPRFFILVELGRIDIHRSQIMAAAGWTKPVKWMMRRS
jgi:hypothetical protein